MHVKAKRGDLAVAIKQTRIFTAHTSSSSVREDFTVGTITSVTRDGTVKRIKPATTSYDLQPRDWNSVQIIKRDALKDCEGFLKECAQRQSLDADKYNPWRDLDDVRATAKKYT